MTYWTRQFRRADPETLRTYHLPQGCDYQGRYPDAVPQPAEAATEVGADDWEPLSTWEAFRMWGTVLSFCVGAAALVAVFWPH